MEGSPFFLSFCYSNGLLEDIRVYKFAVQIYSPNIGLYGKRLRPEKDARKREAAASVDASRLQAFILGFIFVSGVEPL
jgi:hypothetical protein